MLPDVPIWWIFGAAVFLSAWWARLVLGAGIDTDVFVNVVQRILREKNVVRCLKLTAAAGDAPIGRATRAAILASISREEDNNRPAGYRGNRPVSIDSVRTRIRTQYDVAFSECVAPLQKAILPAFLSPIILIVAASFSAMQERVDMRIMALSGVGLLGWLFVATQHVRTLSSRNKAFDALWPNFEALHHDRHSIELDDKPAYPWPNRPNTPDQQANPESQTTNPRLMLNILEPGQPVRTVAFDQDIIKIGALETAHLKLTGEGIARMHAVIEMTPTGAQIIDLGATRQTKVNLEPVQKRELEAGDVIGIGNVDLVVRMISATVSG